MFPGQVDNINSTFFVVTIVYQDVPNDGGPAAGAPEGVPNM